MLPSEVASNAAIKLTTRAFAALKANSAIRSCLSECDARFAANQFTRSAPDLKTAFARPQMPPCRPKCPAIVARKCSDFCDAQKSIPGVVQRFLTPEKQERRTRGTRRRSLLVGTEGVLATSEGIVTSDKLRSKMVRTGKLQRLLVLTSAYSQPRFARAQNTLRFRLLEATK